MEPTPVAILAFAVLSTASVGLPKPAAAVLGDAVSIERVSAAVVRFD